MKMESKKGLCKHIEAIRIREKEYFKTIQSSYTLLHSFFVTCTRPGSSKRKTLESSCYVCQKSGVGARLHACLSCVFIGCLKDHFEAHEKNQEKHILAMDMFCGAIYCFECKDNVYAECFSAVIKKSHYEQIKDICRWIPSKEDMKLFETRKAKKINQSLAGLRGLINLGHTCYINCIIQVFAHTPLMRNYFLSGRHSCPPKKKGCQACLLFEIFQELYSGKEEPLPLQQLIHDLWLEKTTFQGKTMQDALEFYESYLGELHKSCSSEGLNHQFKATETEDLGFNSLEISQTGNRHLIQNNDSLHIPPCRCIIHQLFYGKYQLNIICSKCGVSSSENYESCFFSLPYVVSDGSRAKNKQSNNKTVKLVDCIKKRIQSNPADTDNTLCRTCERVEKEQCLFKVLPNILCFHLVNKNDPKNIMQTKIEYPEYLDMSLYTHETVISLRESENAVNNRKNGAYKRKIYRSSKNMYILYAIVYHETKGKRTKGYRSKDDTSESGGHYYTIVRKGKDVWYECNDEVIEKLTFEDEIDGSGILFFYIKEVLEYENHDSEHNASGGQRNNMENGYQH